MRVGIFPLALLLGLLIHPSCAASADGSPTAPPMLSYEELVQLSVQAHPPALIRDKLDFLLTAPFVSNAADGGARLLLPRSLQIGGFLRVVEWNIERGLEYTAIKRAFSDPAAFAELLDPAEYPLGSERRREVLEQVALMRQADVIVLNEVDWGMSRTEYRNVAAELAAALGMNYAFGVEFVEVDPLALGTEKFAELAPAERTRFTAEIRVDPTRYKGLHGTAILSRFPLENVRLRPFAYQAHDWYGDELKSVSPLERGKRKAAELVFREKLCREVRRGGRMMLTAEIFSPQLPGGRITIVATHLEDKTNPAGRRRQLEELLTRIKDIPTPVVLAGDMNTSTQDATPTDLKRELKKRLGSKNFWVKQGIAILTGLKLPNLALDLVNTYRKQSDPTVRGITVLAPNAEAEFFTRLKAFRFSDGGAFDFRGERRRSIDDRTGVLANSNQRGAKGFLTTFEVARAIGFVGKYKLDWIFVKPPGLTDPQDDAQPHLFAPHFGRTLKSLNESLTDRISDHAPLTVDLPLAEPRLP